MQTFSQRIGKKSVKSVIQIDSMDDHLRNSLWNGLVIFYWDKIKEECLDSPTHIKTLVYKIWMDYFKFIIDDIPQIKNHIIQNFRNSFFKCEWYEVYDFIEAIIYYYTPAIYDHNNKKFTEFINNVLETELSGFRLINGLITPITSDTELESIQNALNITDVYKPVKVHLYKALEHVSNKTNPDYRNSIKESISAVESLCKLITQDPKATLGQALKQIEKEHKIHYALQKSFSNLYGYSSDGDGIRHALTDEDNLKQEDALYMIVSCSAFINYLIKKSNSDKY